MEQDLASRLSRLEALEEIRQLASRYALAVDSRDLDTLVTLFIDDDRLFREGARGRSGLRESFNVSQRRYSNSQHFVCNHVIDLDDEEHAHGVVYSRVEQELGDTWLVMNMQYWDRYERKDGRWYFAERKGMPWYYTDWDQKPTGPTKMRFIDRPRQEAPLPTAWPTWGEFWSRGGGPGAPPA